MVWEEFDVLYPASENGAAFLTTRVTLSSTPITQPGCTMPGFEATSTACAYRHSSIEDAGNKTSFFIADIEEFTLKINHGVAGEQTDIFATSASMPGKLIDVEGNVIQRWPDEARPNLPRDILKVSTLLRAAGVDLNAEMPGTGESIRNAGIQLVVFVEYENRVSDPNSLKYTYSVRQLGNDEFKSEEAKFIGDELWLYNRHGVRIVFAQVGELGKFDFLTLLLNLVAAFALLSLSTLVVEFFMLKLLPQKAHYERYKFITTDDFSDLREEERAEKLRAESQANSVDGGVDVDVAAASAGAAQGDGATQMVELAVNGKSEDVSEV